MKREKVFRTIKRVMAILGIILIVLMYAATVIAAVFVKKYTVRLFLASMIMTMVVPLLLYAYQMTMKIFLHLNALISLFAAPVSFSPPMQATNWAVMP